MDNSRIHWDPNRKDRRDEQRVKELALAAEAKIKRHVYSVYQAWKKQSSVKLKTMSPSEWLAELRDRVMGTLNGAGLQDYAEYTAKTIDEVIERTINAEKPQEPLTGLPNFFTPMGGGTMIPFHAEEELYDIPMLQKELDGAIGLVTDTNDLTGITLSVAYEMGIKQGLAFKPLGVCANRKGLGKLPTSKELIDGLRLSEASAQPPTPAGADTPAPASNGTPQPPPEPGGPNTWAA